MTPDQAPLLSFLLVVDGEQTHLRTCLESVLQDPDQRLEVVVVDVGSSPEGSRVLDSLGAGDQRLRVHRPDPRVGLGPARNLALELARGDYVWVLEPADEILPAAVTDVAAQLAATSPDVLVVDHATSDPQGRQRPGPLAALLTRLADESVDGVRGLPVARLARQIWTLVVRRSFLEGLGARFGPGREDALSVTYPVLLGADAVSVLARPCYLRRIGQPRPGRALDGAPLDIFDQYAEALAVLSRIGDGRAGERRTLLRIMLRDYLSIMRRLERSDRAEFFRGMGESYRRLARGRVSVGSGFSRVQWALVGRGHYRAFLWVDALLRNQQRIRRYRSSAGRRRRHLTRRTRRLMLESYYRAQRRLPVDENLAVYAAYWFRGYDCNPRAVYEKARELCPSVTGVWVVDRTAPRMPPGVPSVVAGSREYYRLIARAKYFVNNVNFPNHLVKRPGTVHVMTHHGTPLKKMGLDLRSSGTPGRMDFEALMRRCRRWDFSLSANHFSTEIWERVYPADFTSLEVGYPRNDVLATATGDDVQRVRKSLDIPPGAKVVLYAPTHREYEATFEPVLDLASFAQGLGSDFVVLARLHYFYAGGNHLADLHRAGRIVDVARYPSVEDLYLAADVLLTDYSSVMFDYAVLDRPIVVYVPDWDVYRSKRGTYFDLTASPPGAVARNETDLVDVFRTGSYDSPTATSARAAFRARFCYLDDGHAAERTVRKVWAGHVASREPKQLRSTA